MTRCHTLSLRNARGMRVDVSAHDASVLSWRAPDRYGRMADVLLPAMPPSLPTGWQCDIFSDAVLALSRSCDGVAQRLHYRLDDDGSLHVAGEALALPRLCFNLQGREGSVGDHVLCLAADRYHPDGLAGGGPLDVAGSAFDFRQGAPIAARLAWPGANCPSGLNHVFCLPGAAGLREAARVADPASGRVLRFFTRGRQLHVQTDARSFSLAAGQVLAYRLGVVDIEALDMMETKE